METKIIDEQKNTGTVIIDDSSETTGTVIIDENHETTGTVLIDNNLEDSGTVIIETSKNEDEAFDSVSTENDIKKLTGSPITDNVEIANCKIKKQMDTKSGEADLYLATLGSETVVFKYYRNTHKPKSAVVEKISKLKNSHIIKLLDYGFYNNRFFEVYEYAKDGNINSRKKDGSYKYLPLPEEKIFDICKEIVEVFNEFHQAGIIHRDIKPDNFLLRNNNPLDIVIGDFGIASVMEEGEDLHKTKTQHHSIGYVPREFFTADYKGIGTGIDYYSLGITLWEFATGERPFVDPNTRKERNENHILRDTFEGRLADDLLSRNPQLSPRLQKLIRGLLVTNYEKRWGYSEVNRFLNGEDISVEESKISKIKVSVLGKTYEDEKELANVLWKNKNEITFGILSKISDALQEIHSYIADDVQKTLQDITDKSDLEKAILKIIYLLNPDNSFELGYGYSISNKDDIIDLLENSPEIIGPCLTDYDSLAFTYISFILGENTINKIKDIIKEELLRNKKYFNNSDSMILLKIIAKIKLVLKDEIIKPFISDEYKQLSFAELSDLEFLHEELKNIILENVEGNIYEGDIVPWLELKTGKRREEFNTSSWDDFYKSILN